MIFLWRGINPHGLKITGECVAINLTEAKRQIQQQNILLLNIKTKDTFFKRIFENKKIPATMITEFIRELATLIQAGIPLATALKIIAENSPRLYFKTLITQLHHHVESGRLFNEALKTHIHYFGAMTCELIIAGEQTGALDVVLIHLAEHREKMSTLRKKISKVLYYPLIVLSAAIMITAALVLFIIPQFTILFNSMGAKLPLATQALIFLAQFLQHYGGYGLMTTGVMFLSVKWIVQHSQVAQQFMSRLLFSIPIIGRLCQYIVLVRSFKTLTLGLHAGLPLLLTLKLTANVSGNQLYKIVWQHTAKKIHAGIPLNQALALAGHFPARVLQMIALGEASGRLEPMLEHLTHYYEEKIDYFIHHLNQLLEPAMMIFLAAIIGGLVIAIYLPIFKLGSVI